MNTSSIPSSAELPFADGHQPTQRSATLIPFWKGKLALVEVALCILVPCLGLLIWGLCDKEMQMVLLSGTKTEAQGDLDRVNAMLWCDDTTAFSVQAQGQVQQWDTNERRSISQIQSLLNHVQCAAYSRHAGLLALASVWGEIEVWDLEHPHQPIASLPDEQSDVESCQFTPDGQLLCTLSHAGEIHIRDARTLSRIRSFQLPESPRPSRRLQITVDGRYLLVGDKFGYVHIWSLADYSLVRSLNIAGRDSCSAGDIPTTMIEEILLLPGDQEFAVVTRGSGISIWNLSNASCTRKWSGGPNAFHCACVSADGTRIIAGNAAGEIWTWETATGRCLKSTTVHSSMIHAIACNPSGTVVISGDCYGVIECQPN